MAVKSPVASNLNPNAPLFVPYSYQTVEDFSPEWWNLVHTSPAFRDYWLCQRQPVAEQEEEELSLPDDLFSASDIEDFAEMVDVENMKQDQNARVDPSLKTTGGMVKNLVAGLNMPAGTGYGKQHQKHEPLPYLDKPAKVVQNSPKKPAARRIQQPR